ncbi:hypothetical protein [Flavilitoribacter nigricans]|uniref:DUF6311 domain-containing protein n=1 Tax=Flavilitoribacter nigricans (strain ATCC 23147 / DSM 23189 / NBRC 102662 / NCIMB 1420 / SS-2) TaxID=1122177 RepID=A0A2D0MYH8_FLAN2|nr:hypothetical protein [Flavilitoribacter nigricans]PHN01331.1 hypothetical protein CRP01_37870 [Flavilitoribacter nigricans DSM 23189 = NBRC 102662]
MKTNRWAWVLLLVLMITLLWLRFPDFFKYSNDGFIEPWGDGYKTYHAYLYHVQHDSTYSHFGGMNYPYGEHVVPGDTEPTLSNGVKWLTSLGLPLESRALGVLNISMLVSLILCALFLYLIFMRLQLSFWYAIGAAVALTFLAPQLHRMIAHYGLARPEVIPMVLYGLLRMEETKLYRYSIFIGLVTIFYSAIHFYFFALIAFTITAYFFFRILILGNWRAWPTYLMHYLFQIIVPLLFFYFWMMHFDPVTDRSAAPWGFFFYRSYPGGILTSPFEPHWQWMNEQWLHIRALDFEARAYIGLVAILGLLSMLGWWLWKKFGPKESAALAPERAHANFLLLQLLSGLAILIFAFGIPFIIPGLEGLVDLAGPIRQFRSIGRFGWVMYYGANIAVVAWLYYRLRKWVYLLILPLALLLFEAYHYSTAVDLRLDLIEDYEPGRRFTDIPGLELEQYQAILPIPYYNLGSDQFWWDVSGFIGQKSMTLSVQTGLPLTAAMLTRTSRSQTINQLQLVTEPYRTPKLLADLPSDAPLLMAWDTIRNGEYGGKFDHLRQGARLIYRDRELELFSLPLSSFEDRIDSRQNAIRHKLGLADSLLFTGGDGWQTDRVSDWIYEPFDTMSSEMAYLGEGAFSAPMAQLNTIYDGPLPAADSSGHVLSVWMFIDRDLYTRSEVRVEEYDPESGEVIQTFGDAARKLVRVFDSNGWALLEFPFRAQRPDTHIRWSFQNERLGDHPLFLDELFIRPARVDVYRRGAGWVWMNNRHFY